MSESDDELAAELAAAVLRVPGVLHAYDARPALGAAVSDAAAALRSGVQALVPKLLPGAGSAAAAADAPEQSAAGPQIHVATAVPVVIGHTADGLTVSVSIGVSELRPAAATCRDVYAVLTETLGARAEDDVASVTVLISRIG